MIYRGSRSFGDITLISQELEIIKITLLIRRDFLIFDPGFHINTHMIHGVSRDFETVRIKGTPTSYQ